MWILLQRGQIIRPPKIAVTEGRHTLVIYSNRLDTGQPLPRAIESFLLQRSLPQMINGLRGELQRRLVRP